MTAVEQLTRSSAGPVHNTVLLSGAASLDEITWTKQQAIHDIARATAPGGSLYTPDKKYEWPPSQTVKRVDDPAWYDDEVRHYLLKVTTMLKEITDDTN